MTIGQRIAYKRKELALSQEALGETLGVSRQAIYKWESDAALPEIDKLVALSKLFGVSVGWLLGVEEPESAEPKEEDSASGVSDELSEAQLKMVKEIVEQYLAAQPKTKRRKWPWVLLGFAVLIGGFSVINRLDQIDQQYQRVQMTVSNVQDSVNSQINGISNRVEEILKSQNNLTAEYNTEISGADLTKNQIRFSVYAVPKTYVEGMEVKFSVDNHTGGINKASGEEGMNHKFTATLATDLTDNITLSATFIYPDGTHETQVLDTYEHLYSNSMPYANVHARDLMFADAPDGHLKLPAHYATVMMEPVFKAIGDDPVTVTDVQGGLFLNKELLMWAEPAVDTSPDRVVLEGSLLFKFPELDLQLDADTELYVAALITDQFGRKTIGHDVVYILDSEGSSLTHPSYSEMDHDLGNWTFE